jgi:carbonic anhydrase
MPDIRQEILAANAAYAADFGDKASLPMPPARGFLILTCMDARMDPAKFAGLAEGDAHVLRNAGGRATDDMIRSMVISHKLQGTREWFVIHHRQCGMQSFTEAEMGDLLAGSLATAERTDEGFRNQSEEGGSAEGRYMAWCVMRDPAQALVDDVARIRAHPLVNPAIVIHGLTYDEATGRLTESAEARRAGAPPRA